MLDTSLVQTTPWWAYAFALTVCPLGVAVFAYRLMPIPEIIPAVWIVLAWATWAVLGEPFGNAFSIPLGAFAVLFTAWVGIVRLSPPGRRWWCGLTVGHWPVSGGPYKGKASGIWCGICDLEMSVDSLGTEAQQRRRRKHAAELADDILGHP